MERRSFTQPANALLPGRGFDEASLLAPHQAIVAYFARVFVPRPQTEIVPLRDAPGRILAEDVAADDDYPNALRSAMDGFALHAASTPGTLRIAGAVAMGERFASAIDVATAVRIPTGGALPDGADAVVPIEDAAADGAQVRIDGQVARGDNVIERGADMKRGERVLAAGRRIASPQIGVLASLGITQVPVYRRPRLGVLSSGDELVDFSRAPLAGQVRDSNRYAIAASLEAMGATVAHFPTLRDEPDEFEAGLRAALDACDGVAVTGGTSVGERDQLPAALAALGKPGAVVHGLRLKPGKPTLLGAVGNKPVLGLPGNPTSALMVLEAVAAPIIGALTGAPLLRSSVTARLAAPINSRSGWTWYVPVALEDEGGSPLAHPLALRSFAVSLTARADGYVIVDERDTLLGAGTSVTVYRFTGSYC